MNTSQVTLEQGTAYSSPESEYWYNVMTQAEMPLAGTIENLSDLVNLKAALERITLGGADEVVESVAAELLREPTILNDFRKVLGISDKRAYLELSFLCSRSIHPVRGSALCGCHPWTMARHPLSFFIRLLGDRDERIRSATALVVAKYLAREGTSNKLPFVDASSSPDDDSAKRRAILLGDTLN